MSIFFKSVSFRLLVLNWSHMRLRVILNNDTFEKTAHSFIQVDTDVDALVKRGYKTVVAPISCSYLLMDTKKPLHQQRPWFP